jgi:hypothetical protein
VVGDLAVEIGAEGDERNSKYPAERFSKSGSEHEIAILDDGRSSPASDYAV